MPQLRGNEPILGLNTVAIYSRFTSRSHRPATKLEFPLSFLDRQKGSNIHAMENSPKIHSLEDLARTK
jgi:hypothetical protein